MLAELKTLSVCQLIHTSDVQKFDTPKIQFDLLKKKQLNLILYILWYILFIYIYIYIYIKGPFVANQRKYT